MLKTLHMQNLGPFKNTEVKFAPHLNLITGDNSLGKSLILEAAWWVLSGLWLAQAAPVAPKKRAPHVTGVFVRGKGKPQTYEIEPTRDKLAHYNSDNRPLAGPMVIHARPNGDFVLFDPLQHARGIEDPAGHFHRAYEFTSRELWNGTPFCKGLIADLTTWFFKQSQEWHIMGRVLEVLSPGGEEHLVLGPPMRLAKGDPREVPTLVMPFDTVPVTLVSAGIHRILGLAYILVWAWSEHRAAALLESAPLVNGLVLLLDELDAHLHPRWQRTILPSVMRVADELNPHMAVQIVASTHAPLVLASAEPLFDEARDALFHLELAGKEVALRQLDWTRRGEVSMWLQSEVFGLGEARSLDAEEAIREALTAIKNPATTEAQLDTHERALVRVLGEIDPVWMRWKWLRREKSTAK